MVTTLSYFLLFGLIILTYGKNNYYNEISEGLITQLSSLKAKYGLNFAHNEGTGSLLNKYKDSHPKVHYIEPDDPQYKQLNNPTNVNTIENYFSLAMNKFKGPKIQDNDQLTPKESLRICRKLPKELITNEKPCNNGKCEPSAEEKEKSEEECDSNVKKDKKQKEKKRYYRAGNDKKHYTVDENAKLLDDLERLLAKNGKYNIFLGCVGDMCVGRSNRDRYDEARDKKEVGREYLGCTGDRCGGSRDDDGDIDVRRRY